MSDTLCPVCRWWYDGDEGHKCAGTEREQHQRALADRDRRIEALTKALQSAILALRSYQYGNCSGELAQSVADACSKALAIAQDMEGNYHDSENLQSRDRRCHPSA